ncbi:unnamed protein product [Gongylonema pulchrum]|uniref:Uncharacterized protein n=1 Tax=Gongylonema pulchrum TaxID=637853 RepID=A0A183E030_9BILA|nr:unnamed protein product [Gongylonema pulchrum]
MNMSALQQQQQRTKASALHSSSSAAAERWTTSYRPISNCCERLRDRVTGLTKLAAWLTRQSTPANGLPLISKIRAIIP